MKALLLPFILLWSPTLKVLMSMKILPKKVFCLRIEIYHITIVVITLFLSKTLQRFAEDRYQLCCLC